MFSPIIAGHTQLPVRCNYFGDFIDVISLWQLANCGKVIPSEYKAVRFRFSLFRQVPLWASQHHCIVQRLGGVHRVILRGGQIPHERHGAKVICRIDSDHFIGGVIHFNHSTDERGLLLFFRCQKTVLFDKLGNAPLHFCPGERHRCIRCGYFQRKL